MSGLLRSLKSRIRSVENTKKITRAMEMVAAAKLHRYQDMMMKGRDFADGLENLLRRLANTQNDPRKEKTPSADFFQHPFLETREEKKIALVLMTSDTGLCGSYNLDLLHTALSFIKNQPSRPIFCGVGKIGVAALKRNGHKPDQTFTDIRTSQLEETLQKLKNYLEELYSSKKVDAIYVVYSHCLSAATFEDKIQKLLPLEMPVQETTEAASSNQIPYIFEPNPETIMSRLIPLFFEAKTRQIFLESFVSEQIARMRSMHQATENASEMIEALVLQRNKVRQAAITKEIIEIISGSQALRG